jgi:predicted transcriptional regulator
LGVRKTEIRVERVEAFFERGRKFAKAADQGLAIPSSRVVAFEDVESLLHVLTEKRVLLLKQVKETPSSIGALARKLKRDRSAVSRDVQVLERFGVIQVTEKPLPGHGKQKWIAPLAGEIHLTAVL